LGYTSFKFANESFLHRNQAGKNRNQAELSRNQASKIPICLARNCRKKCFEGNTQVISAHVIHLDWTLRALDFLTNRFRIGIKRE